MGTSFPVKSVLLSALEAVDAIIAKMLIAIMAMMVAIVSAQVFLRYGFNSSIDWADEVSRLCFVWSIFLAIPLALKRGGHICMEVVIARVPPGTRDMLYRAMSALSLLMMVSIAYEAFVLSVDNWDETIPSIGLSGGLFFVPVGTGAVHTALHLVAILFQGEPRKYGIVE
jgi:TRAP-type C4-dicarboxylate transport system permease small subunit